VVSKALVCCLQCSLRCGRRDLRSVERAVGAIPRPISYLRSDPSTLAVRQPDPFAGARKRGRPWPKHRWSRSSRPANHHAAATEGVRASYRGGEHGTTGSAGTTRARKNRLRALHSAVLGPCCSEKQFSELLPSTEAARYQAHRPRLERGDAPARGTRRGSSEGMAPWRHLTTGRKCRSCVSRTVACHRTRRAWLAAGGDIRSGSTR